MNKKFLNFAQGLRLEDNLNLLACSYILGPFEPNFSYTYIVFLKRCILIIKVLHIH